MKKIIPVVILIVCMAIAAPAFARGGYYRHHSHHGYYGDGDALAGLAVGLLFGAALAYTMLPPPPPRTVYVPRYEVYQPEIVVRQPRICVEERVVSGEWQQSPYDGTRVWVPFPYPMLRSYQTPCY